LAGAGDVVVVWGGGGGGVGHSCFCLVWGWVLFVEVDLVEVDSIDGLLLRVDSGGCYGDDRYNRVKVIWGRGGSTIIYCTIYHFAHSLSG
jgi:hypothetical protein